MKIRIEISSGSVSCVLDKEVDMDLEPQVIFEDIESILSAHEVHAEDIGCSFCDHIAVPAIYEPCYSCQKEDNLFSAFTRITY